MGRKNIRNKEYPVCVFWWQGEDNMPEIVRICNNSILVNTLKHKVVLITKDNIHDYFHGDDSNCVLELLEKGKISYQGKEMAY